MFGRFEFVTALQYEVKALRSQVSAFESGDKYVRMRAESSSQLAEKDREIKKLKGELAACRRQFVTMRGRWMQVFDDVEKESADESRKRECIMKKAEERAQAAEWQRDALSKEVRDLKRELYEKKTELEEERGKVQALKAQINRDYENSSIPSSQKQNRKKITNNREKSGKKPGGQPGHIGHGKKRHTPTYSINIPAPDKYTKDPLFKPTGKTIKKQLVDISVNLVVHEYSTPEFRNVLTGQRVHAAFPAGVVNDVNYGGGIKSFAFLLNNQCNVSDDKISDFMCDITDGGLRISKGMINGLSKEFSFKTAPAQRKAYADLLLSPAMNTDFTSARVNGKHVNVAVCATPSIALYFAREHKGHEGVKGTPAETYQNTLVHDHDKTFYSYGGGHQECLEHVLRYLKDSMANEPNLTWNKQMWELIREMIHYSNCQEAIGSGSERGIDPGRLRGFEEKYDEILATAKDEYDYEPPGKYYPNGFNLMKKLLDYKDAHLLFLHDMRVPHNNNLAERLLRVFKRKLAQAMTFRSFESLEYLCASLGVIASLRVHSDNLYRSVGLIFNPGETTATT